MLEEQNKKIAKWLGLCWREPAYDDDSATPTYHKADNPKFDTWEGFRIIMENGPKQKWWDRFLDESRVGFVFFTGNLGKESVLQENKWNRTIKQDYIGPKLADALLEWIEKEEITNGSK